LKRLFLGTFLPDEDKLRLKEVQNANENLPERFRAKVRWVNDQKLHLTWLFLGNLEEDAIERLQQKIAFALEHYQSDEVSTAVKGKVLAARTSDFPASPTGDFLASPTGDSPASPAGDLLAPPTGYLPASGTILYDHLEIWFARGLPRHLVLTPSFVAPQTLRLIEHIRQNCTEFVHPDYQAQAGGDYRPHVTLLRFKKDGGNEASLPFVETPGSHPLTPSRRVKTRTLAPDGLNKIGSFLPISHHLSTLSIIESKRDGRGHGYSILRSFDLTWK